MKKRFYRWIAGMLAAGLVFSSFDGTVFAEGREQVMLSDAITLGEGTDTVSGTGVVEVLITAGTPMRSDQKFLVTLRGTKEEAQEAVLPVQAEEVNAAPQTLVRFSELEAGAYELCVSGDGYLTYRQTIPVERMGYRIQLYTGNAVTSGNAHAGLLVLGDVNGDGKLDEGDASEIVNAIEAGRKDGNCDLNGDGTVNLLDLNYLTKSLEGEIWQESTIETFVPPEAAELSASEGTAIREGSLETLFYGDGGMVLALENGGAISESNPVEISFDFTKSEDTAAVEGVAITVPKTGENALEKGRICIVYEENGEEKILEAELAAGSPAETGYSLKMDAPIVGNIDDSGVINIDLGGQMVVKKVTLTITKTASGSSLAEISKVEFIGDMENRIPEPDMNIPTGLLAVPGDKSFTVSWNKETNVTGYELCITSGGETEYRRTTVTTLDIRQFGGKELINQTEYTVSVQSTNGEWKSGYSEPVTVMPKPSKAPDAPDRVSVKGGYRSIDVSWSKTKDADSYNLYYKESGAKEFQKISGITELSYKISELKDKTKYEVYLTGQNELGEGAASLTAAGTTLDHLTDAELPEYKLINTSNGKGVLSSHIVSASISGAFMVDSPLDQEENSALGLFDNDYTSYLQREDWDYGGAYPSADKGVITQLDEVYPIGMIAFAEPVDVGSFTYVSVYYWDENGGRKRAENVSIRQKTSGDRKYYLIKTKEPIETSKIQVGVGRYGSTPWQITISEMRFYAYDSIEQDIYNLYTDALHIALRDDVTEETIAALRKRLHTPDTESGAYHPEKESLDAELDMAEKLLKTPGLGDVVFVNSDITAQNDAQIAVGGLNAWQPLGVTAAAGDEIVVYAGYPGASEGASTSLQLVFTQYHAESGGFFKTIALKTGRNEITVPQIISTEQEKGGALYIQYTGNQASDAYAVRVSGGTRYPVLNVYGISGEERTEKIRTYVKELEAYTSQLAAEHENVHGGSQNESVAYAYDAQNCILNSTDIVMNQMMLSIPASQALAGLGTSGREEKLEDTILAMENMMLLFYQHKGLTNSFAEGTSEEVIAQNHLPYRYLNIRYMRMFAGAFMYASGNHIGIEWNETRGMMGGVPVVSEDNGRYVSGRYFGWGIAHEIGHEINQSAYAHAEVTNNYFSVLAQAKDTNNSVRFQYPEVFKKVTSGAAGYADNVFTQLGMYWQLHLAYDRDYNYKTYGTYQEITENLFFARVDSYARNTGTAPQPGGVALTLSGDRDQNIMRLASAAAERDLSEFFIRWGFVPDEATKAYTGQFEAEQRAIYYVDDTARVYEMEHGSGMGFAGADVVKAAVAADGSDVTLTMDFSGNAEELQGYEITRIFTEQGVEKKEIAGFTQENTFTDHVAFASNRVVAYEVTAVDKCMNRANAYRTDAVKIEGDGIQDKSFWKVVTNMASDEDLVTDATDDDPCEPGKTPASDRMIDDNKASVFTGCANTEAPYILLELNRITEISALRYTLTGDGAPMTDYKIEVSTDGASFTTVKEGKFTLSGDSAIVYFENGTDPWICTYDAAYVKLTAVGQEGKNLSVAELDLFGPSGDNVEFLSDADGQTGIGTLADDYIYDKVTGDAIPKGSIVFTGTYKGNPAYNVVVLYDENGEIVGGTDAEGNLTAGQIILAPETEDALLGETSEGRWVYWIAPQHQISLPRKVRAELYRVDNALTNEGQRLVSDTLFVELAGELPLISLN